MKTTDPLPFDEWYEQYMELCVRADWPIADKETMRGHYEDEQSPRDALNLDMSYGA